MAAPGLPWPAGCCIANIHKTCERAKPRPAFLPLSAPGGRFFAAGGWRGAGRVAAWGVPQWRWPLASPQLLGVRKSALGVGRARPLLAAPRRFLSCQTAAAVGQTAVGARYFLPDGHDFCQLAHAAATFAPAPPGGRPAGVIVFCNFARRGSRGASRRGRAADAVTQGFAHY